MLSPGPSPPAIPAAFARGNASASALPLAALAAWIDTSPNGLLWADSEGCVRWANSAFTRITGHLQDGAAGHRIDQLLFGSEPDASARHWLSRQLASGGDLASIELACRHADGGSLQITASVAPVNDGTGDLVVTLVDVTLARREALERQRLAELLEMAQEFGRIGLWERNLRTLEGHWDRHVFRFWGLPPENGTPPFTKAMSMVHPEDNIDDDPRATMIRAGRYSHRYRVIRDDGTVRLLHSHWEVKNGADGTPERMAGVLMDDTEVYELARAASEAHEQLNMAVDLADIVIWRHDLKTGRLHYNERAWQVLDLAPSPEGLTIGQTRSLVHPDDLAKVQASAARALQTNQPTDVEARYRRSDGTWRSILNRRVVQRDVNGEAVAFIGVALDVSEQSDITRRAIELSRRLDAAARAAHIGMWTVDVATGALQWNSRMSQLFGLADTDSPKNFAEWLGCCVHPDDVQRVRQMAMASLKTDIARAELIEVEYRTRRPDGSVRWMVNRSNFEEVDGRRHVFGVTLDITEQRATMDALRNASERSSLAARGIGIGTWELDLRDGDTFWNDEMFILRGLAPQTNPLSPEARRLLVHPEDVAAVDLGLLHALTETRATTYEFRVRLPSGQYRWLASRSTTVMDEQDQPIRRIGVNWDITDSKNADLARQETAIALRESEAKSRFMARMSHELRTPLNAVLGFTQLLLAESAQHDPDVLRLRLGHIRSAGQHLLTLINEVLELSSVDSGELPIVSSPLDLASLVAGTLPLVERMAHEYDVSISAGAVHASVMADPMRLRQVLLNLLSNGIKYNRPGGAVSVTAHAESADTGARVCLTVTDTGRGMTAQQLTHAFEPFNRLGVEREGIEGTGIGLAIVKAMVERMGGTVSVRSVPGEGSSFDVMLPGGDVASTSERPASVEAAASPVPATPDPLTTATPRPTAIVRVQSKGRMLYIEDNPVNVMIVSELVALRPGLRLDVAADGEAGVVQALALRPDLILVDMQLPGIDGHEVLRRLRADSRTAEVPCIALSANAMPEDIELALQSGFADYWTKPLDFKAFMASIDALFH